jgi:hypothetical protein
LTFSQSLPCPGIAFPVPGFLFCGQDMIKRKRKIYDKEIEAAWYVLNPFISAFDYAIRYTGKNGEKQIITVNPNCVIAAQLSRNNLFKPSVLAKSMLEYHFNRTCIIFYKSDAHSPYFTGYGKQDADAQNLLFSKELNITTKKITDLKHCVLLIGIDIDCHNNENHVLEVESLIRHYLPNTYWEYSTGGKGRHGYLKLLYQNSYGVLKTICKCLNMLFAKLNDLKTLYGFEAKIDKPAGLPYILDFVDDNPYQEEWTTLYKSKKHELYSDFYGRFINPNSHIWQNYASYLKRNTTLSIGKKSICKPLGYLENLSSEEIKTSFSTFISDNHILFPPPTKNKKYYKITVQRAFKLPLFGAVLNEFGEALPKMDYIKQFYEIPYCTSIDLKNAYRAILNDIEGHKQSAHLPCIISPSGISLPSSAHSSQDTHSLVWNEKNSFTAMVIPVKEGFKGSFTRPPVSESLPEIPNLEINLNSVPLIEEKRKEPNNCACTNTQKLGIFPYQSEQKHEDCAIIYAKEVEWSEFITESKELDIDQFWDTYHQKKTTKHQNTYDKIMNSLKNESDTMKKTALFIAAYLRKQKKKNISAEEAEIEYVRWGLNTNPAPCSLKRLERMKSAINHLSESYNEEKLGFQIDWKQEKQHIIDSIHTSLPKDLTYAQGKRIKTFTMEEIGYVYYVIKQMENTEQNAILKHSLSYTHIDELFLKEFGRKCGRHKFAGIIKALVEFAMVEKIGSYKVGLKGNSYRIKQPEK